jgi:hypothetical protein
MKNNISFKEILSSKYIKIYHGSDIVVKTPEIIQSVRALDFGRGFYTTTNIKQAESFAKKVKDRNGSTGTYISVYTLDTVILKTLNYLYFDKPDKKWLDFVSANRNGTYTEKIFDIVYGPVANDTVFKTFIAYQNGTLDERETLKRLKVRDLYNQLVFINEESLKCLQFIGEA